MAKYQISAGYRLQTIEAPSQQAAESVAVAMSIGAGIREPELAETTWARPAKLEEMATLDIERDLRRMRIRSERAHWAAETPMQIWMFTRELQKRRKQEAV